MKIDEVRGKNAHELEFELANMKKELFELRFKSKTQSLTSPARVRALRRAIARIHTVAHERTSGVRGQEPS